MNFLSASRVAQFRFTFSATHDWLPYILLEVARPSVTTSTPTNITYPLGSVSRPNLTDEICGHSSERQDSIITPISIAPFAAHFRGYFCARFESDYHPVFGAIQNNSITYPFEQDTVVEGPLLSAHAIFQKSPSSNETVITLRVGTSFISEGQARKNLDTEIPDRPLSTTTLSSRVTAAPFANSNTLPHFQAGTIEDTAYLVRKSWTDILDRIEVLPYANGEDDKRALVDLGVFWTGVVHTLQVGILVKTSVYRLTDQYSIQANRMKARSIILDTIIKSTIFQLVESRIRAIPSGSANLRPFFV